MSWWYNPNGTEAVRQQRLLTAVPPSPPSRCRTASPRSAKAPSTAAPPSGPHHRHAAGHGDSLTSIGDSAFHRCSSLTAVTLPLPDGLTSIGDGAFFDCPLDAESHAAVWALNPRAAEFLIDSQGHAAVPEGATNVPNSAFRDCSGLTTVTLPDSLTSICSSAFYGCSAGCAAAPSDPLLGPLARSCLCQLSLVGPRSTKEVARSRSTRPCRRRTTSTSSSTRHLAPRRDPPSPTHHPPPHTPFPCRPCTS